ncbi:unnamed protein product [Porites lobata]|uniref:Craniofacial development protein 2-like n=1 Tax=Porites lobata TaxID=104759 RepID=A0ABN8NSW2_9CNID|nr:unnamed protein product [Porites lobata]
MIRIGSWNVRTMLRQEKLKNIKDGVRLVYSGGTRRERGVALRLDHQGEQNVSRG